ncbi:hypothetical protein NDN08_000789 [Rhodosorus marinus]|uniref:DUF202 domain-containing protein n=1 Tax=Rhodosorus marinus TaxID=101924 RepID=A0AAV8UNZ2_9RHOD|nr:hypothetical protein NDN08_000789 [Rhodosorus marinus]
MAEAIEIAEGEPIGDYGTVEGDVKLVSKGDEIKSGLQTERTWFKWLFTGLQIGGFGTWLLKFFSSDGPETLILLIFSWVFALMVVLHGLSKFYSRRRAIKSGSKDTDEFDSPYSVAFVVIATTIVVGGTVVYTVIKEAPLEVPVENTDGAP